MANKGNRYNAEFKNKVIAHSRQAGNTIAGTAKHFDISDQTLRNWLNQREDQRQLDRVRVMQLEKKLAEAKRRLADIELTNEILIKATAIFAANKQA